MPVSRFNEYRNSVTFNLQHTSLNLLYFDQSIDKTFVILQHIALNSFFDKS